MKRDCGLCSKYGHACQYHPDDMEGGPGDRRLGARQCGARARSTNQPCRLPAGWGTDHPGFGNCRRHCGNTSGGRKSAQNKMAAAAVVTFGLPREVDPHDALLEEVWRTAGAVDWLQRKVREQEGKELVWGVVEQTSAPGAPSLIKRSTKPSIWLQLYRQEHHHLVDVCRVAIAAGVAERQVRLAEEQGKQIAAVILGVLQDLGVQGREEVPSLVRKHLVLVTKDETGPSSGSESQDVL